MPSLNKKVAIAGLGRIAWELEKDPLREKPCTHVGAIQAIGGMKIISAYDSDSQKCQAFKEAHPSVTICEDEEELFHKDIDVFICATPPEHHRHYLELAMEANIKVVIVEKPLCESPEDYQSLLKAAKRSSSKVLVNHERRFAIDYQRAREIILSKEAGELLNIHASVQMGMTRHPRDILWDDGTHMIDSIQFLLGEQVELRKSEFFKNNEGQQVWTFLRSKNKQIPVFLEVNSGQKQLVFELELRFNKGMLRIGNGVWQYFKSQASDLYTGMESLKLVENEAHRESRYFYNMMQHAKNLAENSHLKSQSSLEDAGSCIDCMHKILLAAELL